MVVVPWDVLGEKAKVVVPHTGESWEDCVARDEAKVARAEGIRDIRRAALKKARATCAANREKRRLEGKPIPVPPKAAKRVPKPKPPKPPKPPKTLIEVFEGEQSDDVVDADALTANLVRDIMWVYNHTSDTKTKEKSAPSPGAWMLLEHVRENSRNKDRFIHGLLAKAFRFKDDQEDKSKSVIGDSDDMGMVEVERLLKEISRG